MQKIEVLMGVVFSFWATCGCSAQKSSQAATFTTVDSVLNVQYGAATNIKGVTEELLLDVFMPQNTDTARHRPLVIFIHGGGFQGNNKSGSFSSLVCNAFAQRGFVASSIDYRLGVEKPKGDKEYAEAMYRAQQDGKAAIRFFRKHAKEYGIDTANIFLVGSSAGAMTCMGIAYMDAREVPEAVDIKKWGTLEGSSGNEGYSSKVKGVVNCWGAMIDYNWIQKKDVPLFNTAGTADKTVPYDSSYSYHGFKYGANVLYQRCLQVGVPTAWLPFEGLGHTLDNKKDQQEACVRAMADWIGKLYSR